MLIINQEEGKNTTALLFARATSLEQQLKEVAKRNPFSKEAHKMRINIQQTYEEIICSDFSFSEQNEVEHSLWIHFHRQTEDFRRRLRRAKATKQKGNKTEFTKICSSFRGLLQNATTFYKQLITKLLDIHRICLAPFIDVELLAGDKRVSEDEWGDCNDTLQHPCIQFCHKTLIHLGDLARYHRDLIGDKAQRNWVTAASYYKQALRLVPNNGVPHHQLALLACHTSDLCKACYRYCRSVFVDKAFPTAKDNMKIIFDRIQQKILPVLPSIVDNSKHKRKAKSISEINEQFLLAFVHVHGMLFTKTGLDNFRAIKNAVLRDLDMLIKQDLLDEDFLLRLITLNICAIHYSAPTAAELESPSKNVTLRVNKLAITFFIETTGVLLYRAARSFPVDHRYIVPIAVVCDYFTLHPEAMRPIKGTQPERKPWFNMWKSMAHLLTVVYSSYTSALASPTANEAIVMAENRTDLPLLNEEIELRGFSHLRGLKLYEDSPSLAQHQKYIISATTNPANVMKAIRVGKLLCFGIKIAEIKENPKLLYFCPIAKKFSTRKIQTKKKRTNRAYSCTTRSNVRPSPERTEHMQIQQRASDNRRMSMSPTLLQFSQRSVSSPIRVSSNENNNPNFSSSFTSNFSLNDESFTAAKEQWEKGSDAQSSSVEEAVFYSPTSNKPISIPSLPRVPNAENDRLFESAISPPSVISPSPSSRASTEYYSTAHGQGFDFFYSGMKSEKGNDSYTANHDNNQSSTMDTIFELENDEAANLLPSFLVSDGEQCIMSPTSSPSSSPTSENSMPAEFFVKEGNQARAANPHQDTNKMENGSAPSPSFWSNVVSSAPHSFFSTPLSNNQDANSTNQKECADWMIVNPFGAASDDVNFWDIPRQRNSTGNVDEDFFVNILQNSFTPTNTINAP